MRDLVIATGNTGKLKEIHHALGGAPFNIFGLKDVFSENVDIEEPGETLEGNALIKAMTIGKRSGKLSLADDTGLAIDFLHGAPGVRTARYGKDDADRNERILDVLKGVPLSERTAKFTTVIAIYDPERGDKVRLAYGECAGRITLEPRGENSFGCAPTFYVDEVGKTMAEMDLEALAKVNHRGRALVKAKEILLKEFV